MGGVKGQRQVPRWYMSKLNLGQNFKLLWGRSLSKFLHLKRHRAWQVGNFCYCVAVCSVLCYIYTHLYILVQNCYSFSFIFACKPHNFWSYNNLQGGGVFFPIPGRFPPSSADILFFKPGHKLFKHISDGRRYIRTQASNTCCILQEFGDICTLEVSQSLFQTIPDALQILLSFWINCTWPGLCHIVHCTDDSLTLCHAHTTFLKVH